MPLREGAGQAGSTPAARGPAGGISIYKNGRGVWAVPYNEPSKCDFDTQWGLVGVEELRRAGVTSGCVTMEKGVTRGGMMESEEQYKIGEGGLTEIGSKNPV